MLPTRIAIDRRARGARYEDLALAHLERAGLALIARNYHCRYGELDLVMRERDVVVFVEVRYRSASRFGDGVDSVGAACRFDVLAIGDGTDAPSIDWRQNAFEAC